MGKKFLFFGVLLLGIAVALGAGGQAAAQEYNQRITVYATVPEMRAVYLDASGNIYKVAGNTANNISPQVFTPENKLADMSNGVMNQYQAFLNGHQGKLAAGKVYILNPISVINNPNTQTIKIESASLTLNSVKD